MFRNIIIDKVTMINKKVYDYYLDTNDTNTLRIIWDKFELEFLISKAIMIKYDDESLFADINTYVKKEFYNKCNPLIELGQLLTVLENCIDSHLGRTNLKKDNIIEEKKK